MIFSKITPFRKIGVGLKWSEIKEMLEALLTFSKNNEEMIQLILVSYYTGMRISEIYEATLKDIDGYLWFDVAVEGGKTKAAKRIIPMHTDLLSQLNQLNLISNNQIRWISPSHNALGKKFLRLRDLVLNHLGQMNNRSQYVHHSFRHGFLTTLHSNGFTGAEVADLSGHEKSNIGKTESEKTYFAMQDNPKLIQMVESIPILNLPF